MLRVGACFNTADKTSGTCSAINQTLGDEPFVDGGDGRPRHAKICSQLAAGKELIAWPKPPAADSFTNLFEQHGGCPPPIGFKKKKIHPHWSRKLVHDWIFRQTVRRLTVELMNSPLVITSSKNQASMDPTRTYLNHTAELDWVPLAAGTSFKPISFFPGDTGYQLLLRVEPGTVVQRHHHTGEIHAFVLSGQRLIGDSTTVIGPGSYVYEPVDTSIRGKLSVTSHASSTSRSTAGSSTSMTMAR